MSCTCYSFPWGYVLFFSIPAVVAFFVSHQHPHHEEELVHIDGCTSLGVLLICLLTCTLIFLHQSSAPCHIHINYMWCLLYMVSTVSLFFLTSSFSSTRALFLCLVRSWYPQGNQCQVVLSLLYLVPTLLCIWCPPFSRPALSHQTCISLRGVIRIET